MNHTSLTSLWVCLRLCKVACYRHFTRDQVQTMIGEGKVCDCGPLKLFGNFSHSYFLWGYVCVLASWTFLGPLPLVLASLCFWMKLWFGFWLLWLVVAMAAFLQFKLSPARVLAPTHPGHRMLWQKLHHFMPLHEALGNYCWWLLWLYCSNSSCLQLECWPPPILGTGCFDKSCITFCLCMKLWEIMACVLAVAAKTQAIASMAGDCCGCIATIQAASARMLAPHPGHRMLWQKLHHFLTVHEALGNYGLCFGCSSQSTSHSFYGWWLLWLYCRNSSCLS